MSISNFLQETYDILTTLSKSQDDITEAMYDIIESMVTNDIVDDIEVLKTNMGDDPIIDDIINEYIQNEYDIDDEDDE